MVSLKKVLIPIDVNDESSEKVLSYAADLAQALPLELSVVHVVPFAPYFGLADLIPSVEKGNLGMDKMKAGAEEKLAKILGDEKWKGLNLSSHIVLGDPAEQILQVAQDEKVDLIIMGNSCSGVGCRILGSVSFKVIQTSTIPVTIFPSDDRTE